jgi:hypothetical protein
MLGWATHVPRLTDCVGVPAGMSSTIFDTFTQAE